MPHFEPILERALARKGGRSELEKLLPTPLPESELKALAEDRILAAMTQCINQAGFSWQVIYKKWPQFEEAFFGFKVDTLLMLSDEQWEKYTQDTRVVRNWIKIKTVRENALFIMDQREHGGIAKRIAEWPVTDQTGLLVWLKRHGSRLGGNTAQWLLRRLGKDGFVLSPDVCGALILAGLDIKPTVTSKKDFKLVQDTFARWHQETGMPVSHLSKILALSFGDNKRAL